MAQSRQLAAIMFTDIVGYTALMDKNEQQAFELLKKNRRIQRPIIENYRGQWLKEMGDGILASFTTVTDAVYAACAIQEACKSQPDLKLRIGIHQGEVVFEDEDVYGSGVNIASRLEPLAPPGGILVSGSVYKNIRNHQEITTSYQGEKILRGVEEPVRVYQVKVEDIQIPDRNTTGEPGTNQGLEHESSNFLKYLLWSIGTVALIVIGYFLIANTNLKAPPEDLSGTETVGKSIAVLPLRNDTPEMDNQYFGNGMLEEIMDKLHKIGELNVLSRTAVEKYRDTVKDPKEIALELGVANIVEGSVRMYQDRFRITIQLIQASTGYHLWSETYDGTLSDTLFVVQSNIAREVADKLNAAITPFEDQQLTKVKTRIYTAYVNYLKGTEAMHRYWDFNKTEDWMAAEALFRQALNIDPEFSAAYSGLCSIFNSVASIRNLDSVGYYAEKAIESDPTDGSGYLYMAKSLESLHQDHEALQYYTRAVEIEPKDYYLHEALGLFYCYDRHDIKAGILHLQQAQKLLIDQKHGTSNFYNHLGNLFMSLGDVDRAKQFYLVEVGKGCTNILMLSRLIQMESGIEAAFNFYDSMFVELPVCSRFENLWKCVHSMVNQDLEQSRNYMDAYLNNGGMLFGVLDSLTYAYLNIKSGNQSMANSLLDRIEKSLTHQVSGNRQFFFPNIGMVALYSLKEDKSMAIEYLQKARQIGFINGFHLFINRVPLFEFLWDDPQYKVIVQQILDEKAGLRAQLQELEDQGLYRLVPYYKVF